LAHGGQRDRVSAFFRYHSLVGVRVENEVVFADTHALILQWLRSGQLDGVRVDHADGLRDQLNISAGLRSAVPKAWVVAEKILQLEETLPDDWDISGTTGYDFLNLAAASSSTSRRSSAETSCIANSPANPWTSRAGV